MERAAEVGAKAAEPITDSEINWGDPPEISVDAARRAVDRIVETGITDADAVIEAVKAYVMPVVRRLDKIARETAIHDIQSRLPQVTAEGLRADLHEWDDLLSNTPGQQPWPEPLAREAFHGVAGEFVKIVEPHSEADPAALLVSFLVATGNVVGPAPHLFIEGDDHPARLFAVLVGETSKARKGTADGRVRRVVAQADESWGERRVEGLSSGEGLIHAVRDEIVEGEGEDLKVIDAGVSDKRLMVTESEFASTLRILSRDGNTLSPVVRNAWDRGRLQTLTKRSPSTATGAHISIMGHITAEELRRYLTSTEAGNGFANRFLWVAVRRSKLLPFGGTVDDDALRRVVSQVSGARDAARRLGELTWAAESRPLWEGVYASLSEGRSGLLGAVTARAEAQVVRLAVTYAALDQSQRIKPEHLAAALAVWEYCDASAKFIFGDNTGDPIADEIIRALRDRPKGMSKTAIHKLLGRNKRAEEIGAALDKLRSLGQVMFERVETGGRPAEVWRAI